MNSCSASAESSPHRRGGTDCRRQSGGRRKLPQSCFCMTAPSWERGPFRRSGTMCCCLTQKAGAADRPGLPPGISLLSGYGTAGQRERPRVSSGCFSQETRRPGCSEPPPLRRKTRCARRRRAAKGLSARKGRGCRSLMEALKKRSQKDLEKASFFEHNAEYGSCRGRHTFSLGIVCPARQKKHKKNFPGSGGMDHGTI